jgi:hypothetical protein
LRRRRRIGGIVEAVAGERRLEGGNLSGGVVRIGSEVHRPTGPWTPAVHALLRHLETVGFDGAPRVLGFDDAGREVVEFLDGTVPWAGDHHRLLGSEAALHRVGAMLRSYHDAVADFAPAPGAVWRFPEMQSDSMAFAVDGRAIICHNDPAAWNLVIGRSRWAFIDWDAAGPRPPVWDLAYCAASTIPLRPDPDQLGWSEPVPVVERLIALSDGYRLLRAELESLPRVIEARIESSYRHMRLRAEAGIAPWDDLWQNGHGDTWGSMLRFARDNAAKWAAALRRSAGAR